MRFEAEWYIWRPCLRALGDEIEGKVKYGETLWRDAQFGMTPAQVSALFPAARSGSGKRLSSGVTNERSIPGHRLGSDPFLVEFFFRDDRLAEVVMRLESVELQDSHVNQMAFERLVAAETREHGRPSGCQAVQNITFFRGCQWQIRDLRIDIVFLEIDGQGIVLNAYYRPVR